MGVERRQQVIPASGRIEVSRGNVFILFSATAAVNLRLDARGTSEGFDNITGGIRVQRVSPWDTGIIIGAPGTTVVWIVGYENVLADLADVFLQVTTVAGTVAVAPAPTATFDSAADVSVATASSSDIAANLLRRSINIGSLSTNAPATVNLRVRDQTGTTDEGIELQPGMSVRLETTAALRIRNNDANAQSYWVIEES